MTPTQAQIEALKDIAEYCKPIKNADCERIRQRALAGLAAAQAGELEKRNLTMLQKADPQMAYQDGYDEGFEKGKAAAQVGEPPTQAQIAAAAKAAWERYKGFPWPGNQALWEDAIKAGFIAAAQVGEQHSVDFLEGKAATIERCAQVAKNYTGRLNLIAIAAAIRKLKDEP